MSHIVEIFKQNGPLYLRVHERNMLPSHRRTIHDICRCRTPSMGGHVYHCRNCGHYRYSYHCCGNRHCPQCRSQATQKWVHQRMGELMPVPYFHLVFTLPAEFRSLVSGNQKVAYGVLFKAAAESLMQLAGDERYLGAQIGILAVLHTWSRAMIYHPHVHLLVPGVGLSRDGATVYFSRREYLVPVKALSRIFRAKFIDRIKQALPGRSIPTVSQSKAWVVFCKHLDLGPEKVVAYLGRYLNRVAIGDERVSRSPDRGVLIRYRKEDRPVTVRLTAHEFLRRYLQHVLPKGLNKVRRYGLFSPGNLNSLMALRCQLLLTEKTKLGLLVALAAVAKAATEPYRPRCPQCGTGAMIRALPLAPDYYSRSPPLKVQIHH